MLLLLVEKKRVPAAADEQLLRRRCDRVTGAALQHLVITVCTPFLDTLGIALGFFLFALWFFICS